MTLKENTISFRFLTLTAILILLALFCPSNCSTTENALGTLLPLLTPDSKYRVFNDLFKQSSKFESYDSRNFGRLWRNIINVGTDLYPQSLGLNEAAGARVNLFEETDTKLLNKKIICRFDGDGEVKIFQANLLKLTVNNTNQNYAELNLENLDYLMIYITKTNVINRVRNVRIIPKEIYEATDPIISKTFSSNFLNFLKPFNLIRFCYWQGQNILDTDYPFIWENRTKETSASQISAQFGISLDHILELINLLDVIPFFCIPKNADDNFIGQMALFIRSKLSFNKKIYLEYGNAYTIMNDIPDVILKQKFSIFLKYYGEEYRNQIIFVLSYRNTQYFINAIGMRQTPVDYDYIDAIGIDSSFADDLNIFNAYNISEKDFKELMMSQLLEKEILINKAYKFAWKIGKELITFSGNPNLKAPRYQWRFIYDWRKDQTPQNLIYKNQEIQLSNYLHDFHNNKFVKEIFHFWLIRLKNIGLKTLISPILVDPYTDDRDFIPLLENLSNTNSTFYQAFVSFSKNETCPITISNSYTDMEDINNEKCLAGCIWGDCINSKCICYGGYEGEKCDLKSLSNNDDKKTCTNDLIGINLSGVADWITELPFIDMMKTCRTWIHQLPWGGWGSAENLKDTVKFDENDYPISLPNNIFLTGLMARDLDAHYDQGIYTVLYDGDGTLNFGLDAKSVKRFIGKIYIEVSPSTQMNNGIVVQIERTNPNDPIRNIRVIRPGFEKLYKKLVYHPLFLSQLKPFNTIRFMDFFNTNSQKDSTWGSRIIENFRTYTINGVPLETMIKLCNILGKNMWINVPYKANLEYIMNMAKLIFLNLRQDLRLYVEYSNEVWGNLFPGGIFAQEQGLRMGFSTDGTQARFCYLGYMTNLISKIFREVFNTADNQINKSRLKIIVSTQSVNADTTKRILECQNTYAYVDAVAIAPYFSFTLKDSHNLDSIFNTEIPQTLDNLKKDLQSHLYFIKKYNLEFYNYESGQGFVGNNVFQTNLQISMQSDPRMQKIYFDYLNLLKQNGVTQTMVYTSVGNWGKYGSWGHLRYSNVKPFDSRKYSGILDFIVNENKRIGNDCSFNKNYFSQCQINVETNIDVCNNMGICFLNNCLCYENSKGKNCEEIQYIDYIDCGYKCTFDQGSCVLTKTTENKRFYGCECFEGYKGNTCGIPKCDSNCNYAGLCKKPNLCECFSGKKGKNCEIDCGCDGHGVCNDTSNECSCDQGFEFDKAIKKCVPLCKNVTTGIVSSNNCQNPNDLKCVYNIKNETCSNNGKCMNGKCSCFPGFSGENCEILDNSKNLKINLPLGINIAGLAYWSTQFIFKNYFYQSSEFIPQYYPDYFNTTIQYTWNTEEIIPTLQTGYPSELKDHQKFSKLLLRDLQLRYPKDLDFVLIYDGDGVIDLGMDAKIKNRRANRIEFSVVPSTQRDNGVYVSILKTNPSNPIRNIRIVNTKEEFTHEKDFVTNSFFEFMQSFSTIRFMDLMHTNGNNLETPEDETKLDSDTQAKPNGINSNLMIKISKYVGASPWICIPHKANDEYVGNLAKKLQDQIPKNLKIYVEYSNEVWNQFFEQGKYASEQAKLLGLKNYHEFYAKRSLEMFNIFSQVFGDEVKKRVKFVISTQFVSTWVTEQILSYQNLAQIANILSVGTYYDCNGIGNKQNASMTAIRSVDEIIQICASSLNTLDNFLIAQKLLAKKYNLTVTAYECGTSISEEQTIYNGNETPGLTEKLIKVNKDARMKEIYKGYLKKLKEFGIIGRGAPAMVFSSISAPSKYGSWDVLDYSDQVYENPSHPKFEAIKEFNREWMNEELAK